jgi:CheY-like chemotaxis protein
MIKQNLQVLLVEDDDVDAEIIRRAFRTYHAPYALTHVHDGLEALSVLRGESGGPCMAAPYIILLDIHLPRMNGIEFLRALRQDSALMWSIVFVLTVSDHHENILSAYREHVAGYFLKTRLNQHVAQLIHLLETYALLGEFPAGFDMTGP